MMRAEDVKVGEWYRSTVPACAPVVRCVELLADGWFNASSLDGVVFMCRASLNEPWAPRVGDWVRWEGRRVDRGGLTREAWRVESVHDGGCAGANRDGGFVHSFRAPDCRLIPAPPPTQAVEPPVEPKSPARERIEAKLAERKALATAYFARANTICARCGGPAYAGLLHVECMAAKCESPAELEPDALELVTWFFATHQAGARSCDVKDFDDTEGSADSAGELVWCATGCGVTRAHPLREVACSEWRLAVGGGR